MTVLVRSRRVATRMCLIAVCFLASCAMASTTAPPSTSLSPTPAVAASATVRTIAAAPQSPSPTVATVGTVAITPPSPIATTAALPTSVPSVTTVNAVTSPVDSTATQPAVKGAPSHIFLIVMENKEYPQIVGSPDAPYINGLAARYLLAERSYAVAHPSLPNYLALLGGDTFGITSDCTNCFVDQRNLVDEMEAVGKTWRAYMEDLPRPCSVAASSGGYALKHDPFLYFRDIRDNPARCGRVVPLMSFAADLASGMVPNFVWITPNLRDDMHDGSVAEGDRWLATFVPSILAADAWRQNGMLVITWDEGTSDVGCCGVPGGGHVPTLVIEPTMTAGARLATPVTHYSLLRTIEDAWGLGHLGHSGDAGVVPLLG